MKKIFLALLLYLSFWGQTLADTKSRAPLSERPKIGLVLSGGGAKGLSHIGILKAIDKAGLKIDYITGTSMGAIIAAMYACGYSGEQIEDVTKNIDWMQLLLGTVDYHNISIEDKSEWQNYNIEIPFEGLFKIKAFTGVMEAYEVQLLCNELFYPKYKTRDFSKLPIPFKCIATDLSNGEAVIMDNGDLPFAVRSSMAIPGAFSATSYKGTKLVDGAMVRNFPVKDVKEMGADFVIGVNLYYGLEDPNKFMTLMDVMTQISNFRDAADLHEEKRICDMIIEPNIEGFGVASFASGNDIIARGDSAGMDFYPLFKQLADSLHNHYGLDYSFEERQKLSKEITEAANEKIYIEKFILDGVEHEKMFRNNLSISEGNLYGIKDISEAIKRLFSTRYYKNIRYELIPTESAADNSTDNGKTNHVNVRFIVDEWPLQELKVGLSYNTFSSASLLLDYQRKNLFGTRSIFNAKIALSSTFRFKIDNRIYFNKHYKTFTSQHYHFERFELPYYDRDDKKNNSYRYYNNNINLSLGYVKNNSTLLEAIVGYDRFDIKPDINNANIFFDGRIRELYIQLKRSFDNTNRKYLPQTGRKNVLEINTVFNPAYSGKIITPTDSMAISGSTIKREPAIRISTYNTFYQQLNKNLTLIKEINASTTWGAKMPMHGTFVGGTHNFLPTHMCFIGLNTAQKYEYTIAMARLALQGQIISEFYATLHLNGALATESLDYYLRSKNKFKINSLYWGSGITLAYNLSRLPFDITLMYSPISKFNINVNIGFPF